MLPELSTVWSGRLTKLPELLFELERNEQAAGAGLENGHGHDVADADAYAGRSGSPEFPETGSGLRLLDDPDDLRRHVDDRMRSA